MYDLDAINADQLVTATDRALRGSLEKYRAAAFLRGTNQRFTVAASYALARTAVAGGESEEVTVYVRGHETTRPLVLMLCALAIFAWLCVGLVCLLG
jgi:hypothetical protein